MKYKVVFSPEAEEQLLTIYHYLANLASSTIAFNYTSSIINYCENLNTFPLRGTKRDEIRPGLRLTNYRKQTVIAFVVDNDQISITGIFYGGQDYISVLQSEIEN
ncbi:MAG: plasmid stabilization protein [Cellvibrio sp. 79]|nr:MAG: plasmid stabilization protein [Cellvibrio sp. 79]